jgi:hypothetical protein
MIYLYHTRKTGGRSLIFAFLAQTGGDPASLYAQLCRAYATFGGRLFRGWDAAPPPETYFAWSHEPAWWVTLPDGAFTVTIFRDPIKRLASHYRMLLLYQAFDQRQMVPKYEWAWLGDDLYDFALRMPVEHRLRQLYMFSERLDVGEAVERVGGVSFWFRLEDYDAGLAGLGQRLGAELESFRVDDPNCPGHPLGAAVEARIAGELRAARGKLRRLLAPEYEVRARLGKERRRDGTDGIWRTALDAGGDDRRAGGICRAVRRAPD